MEPILNKLDVTVLPWSTATKVLFDPNDKTKAIGVQVRRFGQLLNYYSTKETVLSAGAIGSPHLLMLSGVGPKEHLKSHGIPVRKDLPGVGQNLQDHVDTWLQFVTKEPGLTASPYALFNPVNFLNHFLHGNGPLSDNGLGTMAALRTEVGHEK